MEAKARHSPSVGAGNASVVTSPKCKPHRPRNLGRGRLRWICQSLPYFAESAFIADVQGGYAKQCVQLQGLAAAAAALAALAAARRLRAGEPAALNAAARGIR